VREVLASVDGNKTKAAAILKIDRKTLREKISNRP
ncbi:MAG: helix-turn-helix domain-containing protein, partial [Desulfobulbus sp.]|nr:helix-turn-helix domain-containing protein [Desulfobulbus sp.]